MRVLVVGQAVFVDGVSNPGETFGRPDTPNPSCGALCAFQPYSAPSEALDEAAATAEGRLFWGMVSSTRVHAPPCRPSLPHRMKL